MPVPGPPKTMPKLTVRVACVGPGPQETLPNVLVCNSRVLFACRGVPFWNVCVVVFRFAGEHHRGPNKEVLMARSQTASKVTCQGGLAPWQVQLSLRLLRTDLSAGHPVKQVAAHCGLSRSHFEKAFKASLGTPPHRWLVRRRVERAREMLEHTSETIGSIALSCGFADQSHLTRVFHVIVGSSPAAWRRQFKAGVPLL